MMKKKSLWFLLSLVLMFAFSTGGLMAADLKPVTDLAKDYDNAIQNTFTWAKQGSSQLFSGEFLKAVGTTDGDWAAFAAGRYDYNDNNKAYLKALENYVTATYAAKDGLLDRAKATEWHRITFTVLALGGDPTSFGTYNGKKINLIADGVYNAKISPLWKQGINGAVFGLLALDAKDYQTPSNCKYDRDTIIEEILSREISGGGFALNSSTTTPDPDITGMVLQALAPYYDENTEVKAAVDRAIVWLSANQGSDGDYRTYGDYNLESTAQVLVALCSLGIDPVNDSRFVKNGHSVLDGIEKYYHTADGGFIHSFAADSQNPTAVAGESNNMATDQARYALIAYERYLQDKTNLYDFTDVSGETPVVDVNVITDVKYTDWFYSSAVYVLEKGIMVGTSQTTFGPTMDISRGEFVTILGRYAGIKDSTSTSPTATKFADVKSSQYYASHVKWASENGITYGTSETTFDPDAKISREDIAAMMHRFAKKIGIVLPDAGNTQPFVDDSLIAAYAKDSVYSMKAASVINGKGDHRFDPKGKATRAEAATMIRLLIES